MTDIIPYIAGPIVATLLVLAVVLVLFWIENRLTWRERRQRVAEMLAPHFAEIAKDREKWKPEYSGYGLLRSDGLPFTFGEFLNLASGLKHSGGRRRSLEFQREHAGEKAKARAERLLADMDASHPFTLVRP